MENLCTLEQLKARYFSVQCDCGWKGCSCNMDGGRQIADTGDYDDVYCPNCGKTEDIGNGGWIEIDEITINHPPHQNTNQ